MTSNREQTRVPGERGLIFLLGTLVAIGAMSIDLYLPALPELGAVFGVSAGTMQLTISGFLVGLACGQAIFGPLADRYGRKLPLVAGLAVFVVGSLLAALAPNAELFIAARVLQGIGAAAAEVIPMAIVADLWQQRRAAHVMSLLQQILALSPIAAPLIGAFMLQHLGWRSVFIVLAGLGILIALAVRCVFAETLPLDRRREARLDRTLMDYVGLFRHRRFVALALSGAFIFASAFSFIGSSSFIIIDQYGFSPQGFSYIFAFGSLGMIACGQLNIVLLRRFHPHQILPWALGLLASACAVLLALVFAGLARAEFALPLFFVTFCCFGLIFGNLAAIIITSTPAPSGLVSGAYGILGNLSGALAGSVIGAFHNDTVAPPLVVLGASGCAAAFIWFAAVRPPGDAGAPQAADIVTTDITR
ncbi:multidrug effflux MFS transporter [Rhizobium sp. KVB221]|uniref:Bcr/CflA family efflux transporter n=1 Tax=Rhizobium setariae TaxID=2801340 RepID=A0A937CQQ8_9HYPH|nr:multidrug effflux MFS transporter [Rhizobium setariae]MBL0374243.1 multidrug effflux MFS transporter [Rhizobium setariae]